MTPIWAVGLMTGTVLDGHIDVALIKTDGEQVVEFGPYALVPYAEQINRLLAQAVDDARLWNFNGEDPASFALAERALTAAQSDAVIQVIESAGLTLNDIGVVGFHGQTVLHRAATSHRKGATRQLGDGQLMAKRVCTTVAYDFRQADIETGGQGAPLSPVYHAALLDNSPELDNCAVLNLGGVANLTWRNSDGVLIGFDTGPANAPINDFIRSRALGEMDQDGLLAAAGRVDDALLESQLQHDYFKQPYPKSLDRFSFDHHWVAALSDSDGAATLTAFSAAAVARGLDILPQRPQRLVVCGGGRHNPSLIAAIAKRAGVEVIQADSLGWRGDAIEAECFAFLAVRTLRELPISFPHTTGAPMPLIGGRIARWS